ncbi:MAG: formylglycine-generating enzyme family protein [Pseudanabaenaceae cyanobacterium bins.39]|nr:formylglycine-generating enzyme family protein [Pseudanabaenaceae cyanobacterium bins.39]
MDISTENAALIERGLYQIETFLMRFGNDYQALLDYAAIPVVVTPELLNYLRMEFTPKLPWVAEVDLLLSDLFRVVGYEQYAMQSYVRAVLLDELDGKRLDERIGKGRMEAAAKLLIRYVAQLKQENPYLSDRELQRQRWSAMVFIDDRKADVVNEISDELGQSFVDGKPQDDLLGLVTIAEQLSPQLREFPQLINNARTIGEILRDRRLTKDQKESSITRQLRAVTQPFPPLQEFEFEVATIEVVNQEQLQQQVQQELQISVEPEIPSIQLEPFNYKVAKIRIGETQERKGFLGLGATPKKKKIEIIKSDRQGRQFVERIGDWIDLEMVYVPSGDFVMGAPEKEEGSYSDERPQHLVSVPAFLMGKYPITQAQYEAVMGTNPSYFKDKPDSASRPVENVSLEDAQEFCKRLSELTGREYRLPSEAQWEYACRAMPSPPISRNEKEIIYPPFHFGETISTKVANYNGDEIYGRGEKGEKRGETTPVNYFGVANEFGLCDMHGNVWEWCEDDWHGNYNGAPTDGSSWIDTESKESNKTSHPLRGGSWVNDPQLCRSACRNFSILDDRLNFIGFRVISFAPGLT